MACPRTEKEAIAFHYFEGIWFMMCPLCMFSKRIRHDDHDTALEYFWKEHNARNKETSMSTADYKRGVEDALSALTPEEIRNWVQQPKGNGYVDSLDMPYIFKDRKKKLLTKKETKWFFLIQYCSEPEVFRIRTAEGSGDSTSVVALYDSKELAQAEMQCFSKPFGPYSIEIETEI